MFRHRQVDYALQDALAIFGADRPIVRIIDVQTARHFAKLRRLGDHVDHAGRRALPEQHALRTAQHFDPLHVEQVGGVDIALRHAVHHDADGGFSRRGEGLGGDAANAGAAAGRAIDKTDGRRNPIKVMNLGDLLTVQLVGASHGDGHGHIL